MRCVYALLLIAQTSAQHCVTKAPAAAAKDAEAPWSAAESDAAATATSKAAKFIEHFAEKPELRCLNTASFFAELAATASDTQLAAHSRELAQEYIDGLEAVMLKKLKKGTFGMVMGLRHDLLDAMQLLNYQSALGLDIPDGPGSLLDYARSAYHECDDCAQPAASDDPSDLVDALLAASVQDESRFRFGKAAFDVPEGLLRRAANRSRAIYVRAEPLAGGFLQRTDPDASLSRPAFVAKALLATHLVFVTNGFDRYRATEDEAPEVLAWLRTSFDRIWGLDDVELMGEVVASFRAFDCGPEKDALARAGSRSLLRAQRSDGAWGTDARFRHVYEELGAQGEAYDVLHHVWTPSSALRPHRLLDTEDTGFSTHLRSELLAKAEDF